MTMVVNRFQVGVAGLVWTQATHRYLVLRRAPSQDFADGAWECIAGRVRSGEDFESALKRESLEEIGVAVKPTLLIGTTHFHRGTSESRNELYGVVFGGSLQPTDTIRLSPEHDAYQWVTPAEALSLLDKQDPTERWLLGVIQRADFLRNHLPESVIHYHLENGFSTE